MLVKIGSRKVADVKGVKKVKKGITIKKLPATGSYKVSVTATTILKQKLTGKNSCAATGVGSLRLGGLPDNRGAITETVWVAGSLSGGGVRVGTRA